MTSPKYDMKLNPVYQIDWQNEASGKRLAGTKRRVTFRFGFSNKQAVLQGKTGTNCRGEEHQVTLVWSLSSGKRQVVVDGKEVHFSVGGHYDAKVEAAWTMRGGHMMKVVAHARSNNSQQGFRQFDLLVDGFSFFDMPKIYELGNENPVAARSSTGLMPSGTIKASPSAAETAIVYPSANGSHSSSARSDGCPARRRGIYSESETESVTYSTASQSRVSKPVPVQDLLALETAAPPAPPVVFDEFTPTVPQPTFQTVADNILSAYAPAPAGPPPPVPPPRNAMPALANVPHTTTTTTLCPAMQVQTQQPMYYQPAMVSPDASSTAGYHHGYNNNIKSNNITAPLMVDTEVPRPHVVEPQVITPTMMKPLVLYEIRDSPPPADELERAVQSLVNLGDITPAPPTETDWTVGHNATLADIKQHQQAKPAPSKEIMRVHAFDPAATQAGMMVAYGQQGGIPASNGFSASMYYGQQAQTVRAGY